MTASKAVGASAWRAGCLAVIVHFGELAPTERMARSLSQMGIRSLIVANDLRGDPGWTGTDYVWLKPDRNLGYGEGFNAAVRTVPSSDSYLLVNNDVFVEAAALDACAEVLRECADVGVVAPRLITKSGEPQHGPGQLSRVTKMPINTRAAELGCVQATWVTGALMLVQGEVARQIPMDGSYFLGWEDADFCLSLLRHNKTAVFRGDMPAVHIGGEVIGPWWYYYASRNATWFAMKHYGPVVAALVWLGTLCTLPRVFMADLLKVRGLSRSRWVARGLRDAFKPKPDASNGPWVDEPVPMKFRRKGSR